MRIRVAGVLLLLGIVCVGTTVADESAFRLLSKGREAFKLGKYEDAERYYRLAADMAEHGGDRTQFAEALRDLCGALLETGQYAESKRLCLKALGILRSTHAQKYMPIVLNHLGVLSGLEGDKDQSEHYLKESLRVAYEVNPQDPYIARILNNLGVTYYSTGDSARAEKTFKKGIALVEKELGRDRIETVPLFNNLGGLYLTGKKWEAAASLFYRALSLLENSGNQLDLASVLESVGTMYHLRKNMPEAEKAFRSAYTIRLDVYGKQHPKVGWTASKLAGTLAETGQYEEAERLYANALQIYEKTTGQPTPELASTLAEMAQLLRKTNREEAAGELQSRAESIRFELDHVVRSDLLR